MSCQTHPWMSPNTGPTYTQHVPQYLLCCQWDETRPFSSKTNTQKAPQKIPPKCSPYPPSTTLALPNCNTLFLKKKTTNVAKHTLKHTSFCSALLLDPPFHKYTNCWSSIKKGSVSETNLAIRDKIDKETRQRLQTFESKKRPIKALKNLLKSVFDLFLNSHRI